MDALVAALYEGKRMAGADREGVRAVEIGLCKVKVKNFRMWQEF